MLIEHYRGYELTVNREKNILGDELCFWTIFRDADGYEADSSFSYDDDTEETWIETLKERVDNELLEDDPWEETAWEREQGNAGHFNRNHG